MSLVGRFRLGGQVLLGIENLSLAPRWAETISTTKADASGQRYKNHLDNSNDSVRFQNLWAGSGSDTDMYRLRILCRKNVKFQLRALVGRFGSQIAMLGRLDDFGAGAFGRNEIRYGTSYWENSSTLAALGRTGSSSIRIETLAFSGTLLDKKSRCTMASHCRN